MDIKIEKGVPIAPSLREKSKSKWSFLLDMDIGDSFEYKIPKGNKAYKATYATVWQAFKSRNLKCAIRRTSPDTIRVWRVSKYNKKNAKLKAVS